MKNLITYLEAIRQTAKDWHYSALGSSFYSDHLLADKIGDPINGFIDSIKEVCFLGKEKDVPSSKEINDGMDLKSDIDAAGFPAEISSQINLALYSIEELSKSGIMQGEINLLGSVAENLQLSKGLLWRRSKVEVE